jgi:hypothetical protein
VTRTTQEIADVAGCNKNNIWLIEKRALKKLEQALEAKGLKIFLDKQRETEMNEKNIDYTKLEQMITDGKSVDEICAEFEISSGTFYNRKNSDEEWKAAIDRGKQRRKGVPATASNGQVELPEDEEEALRIIEEKVVEAISAGSNLRRAIHTALEMYPPGKIGQAISGLVAARAIVERQCGAVTAYFVKGSEPPATSKLVMNGNGGVDIVQNTNGHAPEAPQTGGDYLEKIAEEAGSTAVEEEDPLEIPEEGDVLGTENELAAAADHADEEEKQSSYCGNCGRQLIDSPFLDLGVDGCDGAKCLIAETPLENPAQEAAAAPAPASPFDLLAEKDLPVDNFSQQREKESEKVPETGPGDEEAESHRRREYEKREEYYYQDIPKPKTLFEHLFGEGMGPGIGGKGSGAFYPMAALMSASASMPQLTTVVNLKSGRLVIDFSGNFFKETALGRDLLCAIAEVVEAHEEQSRAERTPPERAERAAEEVKR